MQNTSTNFTNSGLLYSFFELLQIPDERTGDDIIDAVVVDEEAVGSEGRGCGAKILYGRGSLTNFLSKQKSKDVEVTVQLVQY